MCGPVKRGLLTLLGFIKTAKVGNRNVVVFVQKENDIRVPHFLLWPVPANTQEEADASPFPELTTFGMLTKSLARLALNGRPSLANQEAPFRSS